MVINAANASSSVCFSYPNRIYHCYQYFIILSVLLVVPASLYQITTAIILVFCVERPPHINSKPFRPLDTSIDPSFLPSFLPTAKAIMATTWDRKPLIITLSLVSFFTLLTLSISAAAIGLEINLINNLSHHWGPNGYVKNGQKYTTYQPPKDPGRYPYMFSGLIVSLSTLLSSITCLLVVLFKGRSYEKGPRPVGVRMKSRGGSPLAITYVHGLWAVAWTGLFGFGCWMFSAFKGGCQNVQSERRCQITHVEFAFFFFGAFVW